MQATKSSFGGSTVDLAKVSEKLYLPVPYGQLETNIHQQIKTMFYSSTARTSNLLELQRYRCSWYLGKEETT